MISWLEAVLAKLNFYSAKQKTLICVVMRRDSQVSGSNVYSEAPDSKY